MVQRIVLLVCFAVLVASAPLAPGRACAASAFSAAWSLTGWNYQANLGNIDADPQPELLFTSKADGHYAIVDGLTGTVQQEFPAFGVNTSAYTVADIDGDGQPELLFNLSQGGTPVATVYRRTGATFVPVFSIPDTVTNWGPTHLRSATSLDILEYTPNDIRVRSITGALVWRAATAIPGWTGTQPFVVLDDVDHDGLPELGVGDVGKDYRVFKYSGAFTQLWASTGWLPQTNFWTAGDTQPTLEMFNYTNGRYGIFNALTGALVREFPDFTLFNSSDFEAFDLTGDGHPEILLHRPGVPSIPSTPLFLALHWNGSSYDTLCTHTDAADAIYPVHTRSAAQTELLETLDMLPTHEVRVRDIAGNVLFRASTGIPGWTGLQPAYETPIDVNHDGVSEFLVNDGTVTRLVKYSGTYSQAWAVSGKQFVGDVGNTDGDPQDELMMTSTTDGTFSLVDGLSGALAQTFTSFTNDSVAAFTEGDFDGNGRPELLFFRMSVGGQSPLVTKYQWNGASYATVFSYTDSLSAIDPEQLRDNRHWEIMEFSPSNDVLLRDAVTDALLFKASTDLPGWTGLDMNASQPDAIGDFDGAGMNNLLLSEAGQVRMLRFAGSVSVPPAAQALAFRVLPASPNPFRSSTALRFTLPRAGEVGIRIFDAAGRLVRQMDRAFPAGLNVVSWDGRDDAGHPAPSGVLFYDVRAGGMRQTQKVVRTR